MSYLKDWNDAISRTSRFGLNLPLHDVTPDVKYLTPKRQIEFPHVVRASLGELDYPDIVAQCLSIHHRLQPVLEEWLKCPVLYTIGWIDDGTSKGMFKFDDTFIEETLRRGFKGHHLNIHAWLTLPSLEVIDVALVTSMAVAQKLKEGHGGVIAKPADEMSGMSYKPMLIGTGFLERIGALVEFPLFSIRRSGI